MAAFHPRLEDLPSEFAVFPLSGALLLPRGKLPLNIFESRYLAMIEDTLAAGRMFGMIQPDRIDSAARLPGRAWRLQWLHGRFKPRSAAGGRRARGDPGRPASLF